MGERVASGSDDCCNAAIEGLNLRELSFIYFSRNPLPVEYLQ